MSIREEDKIIKGLIDGDESVINSFYVNNLPKIRSYILNNSGNKADAEDVFQDALVLTYQKLKENSINLNCSLATYVFAVGRNLWMNTLRKRRKIVPSNEITDISEDLNISIIEAINNVDKKFLYQKYFVRLGDACQRILLHFFSGKSMAKISELMGYSEGYARKKKFQCKENLIEMITADPLYRELGSSMDITKSK